MHQQFATLPKQHQTMILVHRAMVRDLDRVARSAGKLETNPDVQQMRALRKYTDRLLDAIEHHHTGEDEILWPLLRARGADRTALALMNEEHEELADLLAATRTAAGQLGTNPSAAGLLAMAAEETRVLLASHAAAEEAELLGRLAPHLTDEVWEIHAKGMLRSAERWTYTFMPPWLASVAAPEERSGVPAPLIATLTRSSLRRRQRAAFADCL